jgi:hypothetical protein
MGSFACDGAGKIRNATLADVGALARLFRSVGPGLMPLGVANLSGWLDRGKLIVLDLGPNTIGAVAFVSLEARDGKVHGCIQFFVVSPTLAGTGTEDRMAAAVLAICEASECVDVDVGEDRPRRSG